MAEIMEMITRFALRHRSQRVAPFRLTVVLTHPVQYYAPWFRYIAAECADIALTVLYVTEPTARQQGVGFDTPFVWDVPLRHGYFNRVVRAARGTESMHSDSFFGLDAPELGDAIKDSAPEAVLVPGWHSISLARALWACRKLNVPAVYRGDSNLENRPRGWRGWLWRLKTKALLRQYDYYFSVGVNARAYLRSFGVAPERIIRSPHCVDNDHFARAADRWRSEGEAERMARGISRTAFVVLYVGKLERLKNIDDAIHAAARSNSDFHLVIVGEGPDRSRLEALARETGARVHWLGFVNQSEIGREYALADCLVLPSSGETWGMVVNEALAAGIPAVVSDRVGSAPDLVIEGRTGAKYSFGNPTALADALARVQMAQADGCITAATCREHVSRYSLEAATLGLLELCRLLRVNALPLSDANDAAG